MHAYRDTIEWGMKERIRLRTIPLYSPFQALQIAGEDEGSEVTIAFENIPPGIRPKITKPDGPKSSAAP